jgi:HPt (histidine-containing phosphotransfer) domain-containing protein
MVEERAQEGVKILLRGFMDTWIAKQYDELRRIEQEGVSPSGILAPFHDALVPGIRGLGERAFSTALGNLHERIALEIASNAHAEARRAHHLAGNLPVLAREFITQRIQQLEDAAANPDHRYEREQLVRAFGAEVSEATRIDLYVRTSDHAEHYFEMKSAKPNKGQCIEMKQRLLTVLGIRREESVFVWWGVPYNPYGTKEAYAHPYPARFFDFGNEVKLGADFWNFVGHDDGTYDLLLGLYRDVGAQYAQQLDDLREALAGRTV